MLVEKVVGAGGSCGIALFNVSLVDGCQVTYFYHFIFFRHLVFFQCKLSKALLECAHFDKRVNSLEIALKRAAAQHCQG